MLCPNCGAETPDDRPFCTRCGRPLVGVATVTGTEPSPIAVRPGLVLGSTSYKLAGFWLRVGGSFVDNIVVWIMTSVGGVLVGIVASGVNGAAGPTTSGSAENIYGGLTATLLSAFASLLVRFAYHWVSNSLGQSLGKKAVGIRLLRHDGSPPGIGPGLGRTLMAWVSWLSLGLGYLWAAWDGNKQTWHDKAAGTYAIRVH